MSSHQPAHQSVLLAKHQIDVAVFQPDAADASQSHRTPRVVLLHEGLGCIALWRQFPVDLAKLLGEPVLAYSRYGYGQSEVLAEPRQVDFMHDEAAQALPQLLDHFDIAQAILIGHSDGASIALLHAALQPDRTKAVVAMAPHLFTEPSGLSAIAQVRRDFDTTDLAQRLARYHRDPRRSFLGWSDVWLQPEFAAFNIEAQVAQIRCPVLAVQGRQDQYGTMRQIRRISELLPSAQRLELADCKHSPHLEQPTEVLSRIAQFIAEL